eukprot:8284500-Prorocentrum_lima.AAC.1
MSDLASVVLFGSRIWALSICSSIVHGHCQSSRCAFGSADLHRLRQDPIAAEGLLGNPKASTQ